MKHLIKRSGSRAGTPPNSDQPHRKVSSKPTHRYATSCGASQIRGDDARCRHDIRTGCSRAGPRPMIMDLTTECSSRHMIKERSVLTDSGY